MPPPQGNLLSLWIRFLRQYLREPTSRMLQPEVEKALPDLAMPSSIKAAPISAVDLALSTAAKNVAAASASGPARRAPGADLSVDASLLPMSGPALTTRAAVAVATIEAIAASKRRKDSRGQPQQQAEHAVPPPPRSRGTHASHAPHMAQAAGGGGSSSSSGPHGRSGAGSSSGGGARKVDVSTGPAQPPSSASSSSSSRFKRCYYVPVLNPLPDLKDKQLAVLDVRLYGIRDMPTFKERPPVLPQSVLTTAKLRGLNLYDINSMMRALEPQTAPGVEEHAEDTA